VVLLKFIGEFLESLEVFNCNTLFFDFLERTMSKFAQ